MSVVLRTKSGKEFACDRNYSTEQVSKLLGDGRASGQMVGLQNNQTPSRIFYIDPREVEAIFNDGYSY